MNEPITTTALTIYVPKKNALKDKLKKFYNAISNKLSLLFLVNKRFFILMLFAFILVFTFFSALASYNFANLFNMAMYNSEDFAVKYFGFTSICFLISNVIIIGKIAAIFYCLNCAQVCSTFFLCNVEFLYDGEFHLIIGVLHVSLTILITLIITIIMWMQSDYRLATIPRVRYIKRYYICFLIFALFSIVNYYFIKLLFI